MKIKSLYIAALIVMAAGVAAVGKDEPRSLGLAVVPVKGSEVFKVIYSSENASKIKLSVYNSSEKVVFSETMNNVDGFIRPLNFTGLPFGQYTVVLTDASGTKVEKVNYQPAESRHNIHVAKLPHSEGSFLVSVAKSGNDVIQVRIFDQSYNLIHNYTKEIAGDFAQLFTLKDVHGPVTFEISDNTGNLKTVRF